jgi:hypothetical protein
MCSQPRWRRNGEELLYFAPDESLMSVSITVNRTTFQPGVPKACSTHRS